MEGVTVDCTVACLEARRRGSSGRKSFGMCGGGWFAIVVWGLVRYLAMARLMSLTFDPTDTMGVIKHLPKTLILTRQAG